MSTSIPLFPPYLNAKTADGLRSHGAAVTALQKAINIVNGVMMSGDKPKLEESGIYDDSTEERVLYLQEWLGFTGNDVDGNFGPATRERLIAHAQININNLTCTPDDVTHWIDQHGIMQVWPQTSSD